MYKLSKSDVEENYFVQDKKTMSKESTVRKIQGKQSYSHAGCMHGESFDLSREARASRHPDGACRRKHV